MHVVAVLAFDGIVGFDLTIPCQVFSFAPGYEVRVCADSDIAATAAGRETFRLSAPYGLDDAHRADTVVVPGGDPASPPPRAVLELLREAVERGARVASICTGAFVLAAAGLLDGRPAATHWLLAGDLARAYPEVEVDPSVLFVDDGQVLTSAGVASGLDLCLHIVRRDRGAAAAAETGRLIVMPPQRPGGQAQFIEHRDPVDDTADLGATLRWMQDHLAEPLTVAEIAAHAALSPRHLSRRFRAQTGTTPLRWLLDRRVQRARELLETTGLPVERIARTTGFGTVETLRYHFGRQVGTTPTAYRAAFR
ncbi:DJ-1/PfpI family protein [Streptomonospora sp. S1-112]|uniref:DJ-1/PfpI family protein n=1 Tax=Streptomonospora mangrovi TaxID=2883123 RepID=A0A9X3SGM7_9ACTN|nr:helix-turn-helix domain-containing protein [Streptomonospora mangrovi]MDA0564344.1 DJ-1/PfpI family protein [Streptomonospora mangrovi]